MSDLEFTMPAEALIVRPGDVLILRVAPGIYPSEFQRFHDSVGPRLKELLPDVQIVIIGGIEQMMVYRPDGQAAAVAEGGPT